MFLDDRIWAGLLGSWGDEMRYVDEDNRVWGVVVEGSIA